MEWIMQVAKEHGLFAALVVYVLWDSRQREIRYVDVIDKLSDSFQEIKHDVAQIKTKLWG